MSRTLSIALCVVLAVVLSPVAVAASTNSHPPHKYAVHKKPHKHAVHKKKHRPVRHWHGYGYLPGVRPPEAIERERAYRYWESGPHYYGPAWPRFFRGRWNGGGFGPCYAQTPIGYMWTCGK